MSPACIIRCRGRELRAEGRSVRTVRRTPAARSCAPADDAQQSPAVTLLGELVATSRRVGATAARSVKIRELASLLAALPPQEAGIAAHYLAGEVPQGRIGVGFVALQAAMGGAAPAETLTLREVDERLTALAATRGSGSAARRAALLRELFSRASAAEQTFLLRLLAGELRQGALAGSHGRGDRRRGAAAGGRGAPRRDVRRAPRSRGARGAAGGRCRRSTQFQLAAVLPGRADAGADRRRCRRGAARAARARSAFEWKMDGARIQAAQARRGGAPLHALPARCQRRAPGDRRVGARFGRRYAGTRRRGDRLRCRRPAAPVPDHHAPLRPQAERRSGARRAADPRVLLRLSAHRGADHRRPADARALSRRSRAPYRPPR